MSLKLWRLKMIEEYGVIFIQILLSTIAFASVLLFALGACFGVGSLISFLLQTWFHGYQRMENWVLHEILVGLLAIAIGVLLIS